MKITAFFLAILLTLPLGQKDKVSKETKKDFKKLEWILDSWDRTNVRPGNTASETWSKESKYVFSGMGVSMKGSDTTFVEKLRIEVKEDVIYYVADVSHNKEPTYFKMTEISENGFVSENPDHDFPKMISYELKGDDLTAIISDGGDKKMGFIFKRSK